MQDAWCVCGHETLFHCIYMVFDYEFDQMLAYSKHNDYVIYGDATNYMNIEQYIDLLGLVLPCPLQPIFSSYDLKPCLSLSICDISMEY